MFNRISPGHGPVPCLPEELEYCRQTLCNHDSHHTTKQNFVSRKIPETAKLPGPAFYPGKVDLGAGAGFKIPSVNYVDLALSV